MLIHILNFLIPVGQGEWKSDPCSMITTKRCHNTKWNQLITFAVVVHTDRITNGVIVSPPPWRK